MSRFDEIAQPSNSQVVENTSIGQEPWGSEKDRACAPWMLCARTLSEPPSAIDCRVVPSETTRHTPRCPSASQGLEVAPLLGRRARTQLVCPIPSRTRLAGNPRPLPQRLDFNARASPMGDVESEVLDLQGLAKCIVELIIRFLEARVGKRRLVAALHKDIIGDFRERPVGAFLGRDVHIGPLVVWPPRLNVRRV